MKNGSDVWKGLLAGLAGGACGTLAMTAFQNGWSKLSESWESENKQSRPEEMQREFREQDRPEEPENATVKAAEKISKGLLHREIPPGLKQKAGAAVHFGFGTIMGGVYGVATEVAPAIRKGYGLSYGAALFLGADELAVPALGLSKPANQAPLATHLYALVSHLVYGASTELVRRGVRSVLA